MARTADINLSSKYDDLGDFDFDVDESGVRKDQVAQPSKIRSDYIPEMKAGFLSGLKQEIQRQMPFTASAFRELDDVTSNLKSMTQDFSKEAAPYLRSIGRSTNRLMPIMQPFLPKKIYSMVTGKLAQIPDEDAGEMSEEERRDQQISADINATLQTSDAKAQIRSNVSDATANIRHAATMRTISSLAKEMRLTNAFLSTSMIAYMKKDLELQYRQLHTQRDISSTLRATAKLLDVELKNITHNTGLPEQIKSKDFEHRSSRSETLREYSASYWKKFFSNFKANILDQITEGLSGVEMAASSGADAAEMMQEMGQKVDPKNFITKMMFRYLGNAAGSKLVGKSAGVLKHFTGGIESGMENLHENIIRGMSKYVNSSTGLLSWLLGSAMPGEHQQNFKIGNVLGDSPLKTVQYDISSKEALVTVIPGYLSQLLKKVDDISDPGKEHEQLVFDSKKMMFVPRSTLGARTDDIAKQIFTPKVYGSDNHLGVLTAGRVIRGEKGEDVKKWLLTKNKDGETNREKVVRFFTNIARLPSHQFSPELLETNLDNKDISIDSDRYWKEATRGLGNNTSSVIRWILDSVTNTDGTYNKILVNKYQALVDQMSHDVDVNVASNRFTTMMNESAPEIRSMLLDYATKNGLYDRDRGELVRDSMNEHLAKSMSSGKLDVSQWDTDKYVDATMSNKWSFSLEDIIYRMLGKAGDKINPLASKARVKLDAMQKEVASAFTNSAAGIRAWGSSTTKSIFGENAVKSFDALSEAVLGRYKSEGGMEMMALDIALLSDNVDEEDKELVRQFADAAMHAEKDSDIGKARLVAIAAFKSETVRNLFSEATQYIVTKRDATIAFGNMKERMALLNSDEHVAKLKAEFKSKVGKLASKAKAKAVAVKNTVVSAVKDSTTSVQSGKFSDTVKRGKKKAEELWSSISSGASGFSRSIGKTIETSFGPLGSINTNVMNIYTLLQETLKPKNGVLTPALKPTEKPTEVSSEKPENQPDQGKTNSKKTFKSIMSQFSAASKSIAQRFNPMASPAAKIGSKYNIDFNAPESKFHADFLKFFAYQKEINVLMANYAKHNSFFGASASIAKNAFGTMGTLGRTLIGASGTAIGGMARGIGSLGGGIAKSLFYKVKTGDVFIDIYRKDFLATGNTTPLLSAIQQEAGLWILVGENKFDSLYYSAQINRPIFSKDKSVMLISPEDIQAGLVNIKGIPIVRLVPHEYAGLIPTVATAAFGVTKVGYDATKEGLSLAAKGTKNFVLSPFRLGYRAIAGWKSNSEKKKTSLLFYDIYRKDKKVLGHPLLSAQKQRAGEAVDAHTGKRIKRTIDINGPVVDSVSGETIITEEDIEAGLVTFDGVKLSELAAMNVSRGNTFSESMGEGFKNLGGFLKNSAIGVGKLLDISKIFAGAGGALLKGAGAVGLHAADFSVSALERLFGFDSMSSRRFEKKYKPLLSRMDRMTLYLKEISENTKKKKVKFDTDNNGVRDNAAQTDEDYASQRSGIDGEAISETDKRKKKKTPEESTSLLKSIFNFLKDPKGTLLRSVTGLWANTKDVLKGIGWMAKSAFWTLPKWLITVGFPTTWAAILKGGKGIWNFAGKMAKGNIGALATVAGAGIAGVAAYNMLNGYKDDTGKVTSDSLESISDSNQTKQTGTNIYRTGKLITAIEHGGNAAAILPNVADESSMFAQLLKKCKFDKMLDACKGKWALIKDLVASFIKKLSALKPKSLTAVGAWFKRIFTVARSSRMGVWVKYLRMFSFLKGVSRIFMIGLNYLFEPVMMALDGYIRSEVMKAAAETSDPSLIDEYEEQNKFGFGRLAGAILTGGLSEVYNLSASSVSQLSAATIESQLAKSQMSMLRTKRSLALKKEANDEKKKGNLEYADNLDIINRQFATLKVDASSSWFNSFSSTREEERANKRDNAIVYAKRVLERLSKNFILLPKMVTILSEDLIKNFTDKDAISGRGVGYSRNQVISGIADSKSAKELADIFTGFSFLGKLAVPGVRDMMISYLSDKGCSVKEILVYAKEQDVVVNKVTVEQEKKNAAGVITPVSNSSNATPQSAKPSDSSNQEKSNGVHLGAAQRIDQSPDQVIALQSRITSNRFLPSNLKTYLSEKINSLFKRFKDMASNFIDIVNRFSFANSEEAMQQQIRDAYQKCKNGDSNYLIVFKDFGIEVLGKLANVSGGKPVSFERSFMENDRGSTSQAVPESFGKKQETPVTAVETKKPNLESDKRISDLEAQIDFLKKALNVTNANEPLIQTLKQLVELQSKNNDLVSDNGKKQVDSTNLFGNILSGLGKQQSSVLAKVNAYGVTPSEPKVLKPALQSVQGVPQGAF